MRRVRAFAVVLLASAGAALGGMVSTLAADAPVLTHAARLDVAGGLPQVGKSATWASSNWSGYAEAGGFTAVSGSWTVPTVSAGAQTGGRLFGRHNSTSASYSATWLGVDGFNNSNLIQTGTEQDFYGGSAHYSAWWEILPAAETVISGNPVAPGDVMQASIVETPTQVAVSSGGRRGRTTTENEWTITIADTTAPDQWTFTTTQAYGGSGSSAEWIVEAPEVNGSIAPLANYAFPTGAASSGDFNSAEVATTVGGPLTEAGLNYANDAGVLIQNNSQVSTPGPQDLNAEAFNSDYGSSAPAPPAS